jgi:hypothetical protein
MCGVSREHLEQISSRDFVSMLELSLKGAHQPAFVYADLAILLPADGQQVGRSLLNNMCTASNGNMDSLALALMVGSQGVQSLPQGAGSQRTAVPGGVSKQRWHPPARLGACSGTPRNTTKLQCTTCDRNRGGCPRRGSWEAGT